MEPYRLYEHKGLKWSIFQDDRQIAAFRRNRVKIGGYDRYEVRMNDDGDLLVVLSMVITTDDSGEAQEARTILIIEWGNPGWEARPFDEKWVPT